MIYTISITRWKEMKTNRTLKLRDVNGKMLLYNELLTIEVNRLCYYEANCADTTISV